MKQDFVEPPYVVLPLYYRGGQIYCFHLDGYRHNDDALLNRLQKIESYISSQNSTLRIWLNVTNSNLSPLVMNEIMQSLYRVRTKIYKISIIGLGLKKFRFHKLMKKTFQQEMIPIQYYQDAELAKNWLV